MTLVQSIESRIWLSSPTRRMRFRLAASELERFAGGRPIEILDAGCSEALLSERLGRRHPDWSIVGVDLDADVVRLARERIAAANVHNVRVQQGDLTASLGTELYDAVLALECLLEIPDDRLALRMMAGALRPDGLLLAQIPERDWKPISRRGRTDWHAQVRRGYVVSDLHELLVEAGYDRIRITPVARSLARLGSELDDRVRWASFGWRLAWYPIGGAVAALDRRGLTWGPGSALFVHARRARASAARCT